MKTKVWVRNGYRNIDHERPPRESRELDAFIFEIAGFKPFVKLNGKGWYKMHCNEQEHVTGMLFVTRTLASLSLGEWLNIALDNKFSGNIK